MAGLREGIPAACVVAPASRRPAMARNQVREGDHRPAPLVVVMPDRKPGRVGARWFEDRGTGGSAARPVGRCRAGPAVLSEYDELDEVVVTEDACGKILSHTYDKLGRKTGKLRDVLVYGYNDQRLPTTLAGMTGLAQDTTYLPAGERINTTLGVVLHRQVGRHQPVLRDGPQAPRPPDHRLRVPQRHRRGRLLPLRPGRQLRRGRGQVHRHR